MHRRLFLKTALSTSIVALMPGCVVNQSVSRGVVADKWSYAAELRSRIKSTSFKAVDFSVLDFGALGDNQYDNTLAFKLAIAACHQAGGGRVVVPQGTYFTAAIHLKSNVNLHLEKNAILRFNSDPQRYLPAVMTRWEGVELMGYSPFIYAFEQENVALTGEGIIDGGADNQTWWPWKGPHKEAHWRIDPEEQSQKPARAKLFADAEAGVPVAQRLYAEGSYLRPAFVQTYNCKRVLIEGITLINSPFWLIHPVLCEDVIVRGVTCRSHGPNNDGCDPESCNRVLIEDCIFDTGDDCIALKSGRNADGRRLNRPVQNVLVKNCQMKDGHGGLVIGSEISGGANHIFMEDCVMSSPELERAIRIKTNSVRGGLIENINVRNVHVGQVKDAIVINFLYEEGDAGQFDPMVRDINIRNFTVDNANHAMFIKGFARAPIVGLTLDNCQFKQVKQAHVVEHVKQLTLNQVLVAEMPLLAKDLVSM